MLRDYVRVCAMGLAGTIDPCMNLDYYGEEEL